MKTVRMALICALFSAQTVFADTFLVTAATSGLGQAVCEKLASQHHDLIIFGRTQSKLQHLKNNLLKYKVDIVSHPVDYTDIESITKASASIKKNNRSLDGMVLITPNPELNDNILPTPDSWHTLFNAGFTGPLEVLKQNLSHFSNKAAVVVINGITSKQVIPNYESYGVLRAMWMAEAKGLSHQLGPKGITVNSVSPGGTLTEHYANGVKKRAEKNSISEQAQLARETAKIPLRRYGEPQEVAQVISFLLSKEAQYVTGTNITVDGGATTAY